MGLLTLLLKLPFLPVTQLFRVAELIREETERQYHDPARVRRELEEAQQQWAAGGISEDELSRIQYSATSRLFPGASAQQPAPETRGTRRVGATRREMRTGGDRHG